MSRPQKSTINYFPHNIHHGKTIYILENRYGNDGYAFWFKLLEILGNTEGMYYDCNNVGDWEFLLAKTRVTEDIACSILNTLAELDAIDKELWTKNKIIWCQNLVDNVKDAFRRRKAELPKKPLMQAETTIETDNCQQKFDLIKVSAVRNGEKKLKEKKLKERKLNESEIYINPPASKNFSQEKNKDPAAEILIRSYGRSPTIPEREFIENLIMQFGGDKTLEIMKEARLRNFRNFKTLENAIDKNGNIKPKEENNGIYAKHINEDKLRRIAEDIARDPDLKR